MSKIREIIANALEKIARWLRPKPPTMHEIYFGGRP